MKTKLFLFLALAALASCTRTDKNSALQAETAKKMAGQYQGVTPCADCEGIEYLLTLKADFSYLGAMVYRGKNAPPVPLSGKWSFSADNRIKLEAAPPESMNQFEIGENQLIMLDQQGQRITGELADKYILWKEGFSPSPAPEGDDDPFAAKRAAGIDFIGTGTEPFWGLELDFDKAFRFVPVSGDSLNTPPVFGLEKNGTLIYDAKTEAGQLIVQIKKEPCSDGMSDREYQYSVVAIVNGEEYKGCGTLLAGSLGSYWTLQTLNGTEPDGKMFLRGLPTLQIDAAGGKYSGNDGCNILRGTLKIEGSKIKINPGMSTRMACPGDAPKQYMDALLAADSYQLEGTKLTLMSGGKATLVYGLR